MTEPEFTFPSIDETMRHPAFPSTVWQLSPSSSGTLPVGKTRSPVDIYWEIHGHGPIKLFLIMGLAGTLTSWQPQTLYFGHMHASRFSVLVLDNRGMGRSGHPLGRYTTKTMALDALEVLSHVNWSRAHVVGISLGGMIAQELAFAAPDRIASLCLVSTSAGVESEASFPRAAWERMKLFRPKTRDETIVDTARSVFVLDFLAGEDSQLLPSLGMEGVQASEGVDGLYGRFGSNFQRFQAQEVVKRQKGLFSLVGFFCQLMAAAGHWKSPEQLGRMADAVGRERIMVLHGRKDGMLHVRNGERLVRELKPGTGLIVEGMGHAPIFERSAWFNALVDDKVTAWAKL